jgi:hypothetical protein
VHTRNRARNDRADDHRVDGIARMAFELEQLVQPDCILIGGAARIGGDAPTRADLPLLHQREDEVGVSGIDGEKHGSSLR